MFYINFSIKSSLECYLSNTTMNAQFSEIEGLTKKSAYEENEGKSQNFILGSAKSD